MSTEKPNSVSESRIRDLDEASLDAALQATEQDMVEINAALDKDDGRLRQVIIEALAGGDIDVPFRLAPETPSSKSEPMPDAQELVDAVALYHCVTQAVAVSWLVARHEEIKALAGEQE